MNTLDVVLADLVLDEDKWPRQGLNEGRVKEFEAMYAESPDLMPHIEVSDVYDDGSRALLDGWHRVEAARRIGLKTLSAFETVTETDGQDYLIGVRRSAVSSLPMTRAEKRISVDRLIDFFPEFSDRQIAKETGVSQPFVSARRRALRENSPLVSDNVISGKKSGTSLTAEQAAKKLMHGMKSVLAGGLFIFNKDGNMSKVLSEAASKEYGDSAASTLAQMEGWITGAKRICESTTLAK